MDCTHAYRDARARITELLRAAATEPAAAGRLVPACPEWTVKDAAAHMAGVAADILAGNLEGVGTDPWTNAQVEQRAEATLDAVLAEWDEAGPAIEELFAGGSAPAQLVFDLATHEHDVRGALGAPGAKDADSTHIAEGWVLDSWSATARGLDVPPLRLVVGSRTVEVGDDPPTTVFIPPFEALRALTGRRSVAQLVRYDWDGDPTPWLPTFTWGPFTVRATDLVE